jgi:hypothetical protein
MTVPTSTSGSNPSLLPQCPTRVSERKLDVMARISPTIKILLFVLVSLFSFKGFAQSSSGTAATQLHAGPRVQLEGELQIQYQDFKDHSRITYTLKLPNGKTVPLQFTKNPPTHFLTGDHVKVDGQESDSGLVLYSGSTSITSSSTAGATTSSIPVPYTLGPQSTLVILLNFQDNAIQPYTAAEVESLFSGTVNNFMSENSYGQTSIVPTVVGWFTIPESVTTCSMSNIATDAQNAAAAAGVTLSNYSRYVYVFPPNSACGFAGSSYVGGNPSQSWINGSMDFHTVDHELGHALGLWHAHLLDCGTSSTVCSNGNLIEYGDALDTMGQPQTPSPHYNAFQKERLGWLNYGVAPSIQTITSSGTYSITPFELGGSGPNALKILKSVDSTTGAKTWYYIEARQAVGFDAFLMAGSSGGCFTCGTQNETNGVLFHLGTDGNGNTSQLLDMTPSTLTSSGYYDQSLVAGQTFQDSSAGVTFTTTSVGSSGATIQVSLNGSSCNPGNPSVSVSPSQSQAVTPGSAVSFVATVVNNDSSACSTATFNLGDLVPSGWTGVWSASKLQLSPGNSGSATLTVTSPAGTSGGSYNVLVDATNGSSTSDSGSATGTYVVATPGSVTINVSTNQSTYQPGQTVAVNVSVLSGLAAVTGANVTVTITPPSGKLATLKGTTGGNGVATLSYKLSRRAASGTYKVGASAAGGTTTGASSISLANTSFTVQ